MMKKQKMKMKRIIKKIKRKIKNEIIEEEAWYRIICRRFKSNNRLMDRIY